MIRQVKNLLKFFLIISLTFLLALAPSVNAKKNSSSYSTADNFSFKSFTGDYFVTRDENKLAKMHVIETLVAEFPNHNQNHGIKRVIPTTSNAGKNVVIANPSKFQAKIKRNGNDEPYTSSFTDGNIILKIGNPNTYVTGEQTYTIEYDFENIIKDVELKKSKDDDKKPPVKFQEIYWNTNGNAWKQPFGSVTANVHVDKSIISELYNVHACYSGSYGSNSKCDEVKEIEDGFTFTTKSLSSSEGMTFAIAFVEGTFTPAPSRISYLAYFALGGMILLYLVTILLLVRRYCKKIAKKRHFYKNLLTSPQFTPLKDYTIAEASSLYIKPVRNSKVAAILELAIQKKIEIIKQDSGKKKLFNQQKWSVKILDNKDLSKEQSTLLQIMNGKTSSLTVGQIIELKSHGYSSTLSELYKRFDQQVEKSLREHGDIEPEAKYFTNINWKFTFFLISSILIVILSFFACSVNQEWYINTFGEYAPVAILENKPLFNIAMHGLLPGYFFLISFGLAIGSRYLKYTNQGLEQANYLNGLEMYIKMAETDRLKFLQSVDGADTTNEGIVKLYEKLLPYAIIFGEEKSWLKSLEQYYKLIDDRDVAFPAWYSFSNTNFHSLSNSISRSVSLPGSSGGSGFSGGFSGGGGGGGGGGGW